MDGSDGSGSTSRPNVPQQRYELGRILGYGSFSKVIEAVHFLTGLKVAIKILNRQSMDASSAEKVVREINIMKQLRHPHIVRLFEVIETHSKIFLVMEYMNSGDLFHYITLNGQLNEDMARFFFRQIISGVEYCHRCMVVHRDLKPDNLLLDSQLHVKIADFGLGNFIRDGHLLKTSCGSPNYAAPEVISGRPYPGPEVDVWSCGVILYVLLCARLPFDVDNLPGLYAKIKSGVYPVPGHLSENACDLIAKMLVVDPMKRISIPQIRRHPWFAETIPPETVTPLTDALNNVEKVDFAVVNEMVKMGFTIREVIESLHNHMENEATVAYCLLLHNRMQLTGYQNEIQTSLPQEFIDDLETHMQTGSPLQSNWSLGFKSQGSSHETMTGVLKVFQHLNVKWKKIGDYNMKCLWSPPFSTHTNATNSSALTQGNPINRQILSSTTPDAIKFEIQLYKGSGELYVLDLQRLTGPPLLFLEICAAFRALAV